MGSTRHSRFGSVFEIKRTSVAGRQFFNGTVTGLKGINLDAKKKKKNVKLAVDPDTEDDRKSPIDVQAILRDAAVQIVNFCYNLLMPVVFHTLKTNSGTLQYDRTNFFRMIR